MKGREAVRLEDALRRAERGEAVEAELVSLVQVARRARVLAGPVPAPPRQLAPGRQRFLAEAGRLRQTGRRRVPARAGVPRLVPALMALIGVLGLFFGTGAVAAASLPGQPLYGLKLAAEGIRVALTSDPLASAALYRGLANARLDEIVALLEQGKQVDERMTARVQRQLDAALDAAIRVGESDVGPALRSLEEMLQQRQQTLSASMAGWPEPARATVRQLVREMERVRQEAHAGQGDPAGEQQRWRRGTPSEATDLPEPTGMPLRTGIPGAPEPTGAWDPAPSHTPRPTEGVGPQPTPPSGPGASATPRLGPGAPPEPQSTSMPGPGNGSGSEGHGRP